MSRIRENLSLTYDDVLLVPQYSEILPAQTKLNSRLSRNIDLQIPLVSAAMDTVTEVDMAIAMAQQGGMGVIHKNMEPRLQAKQVTRVKKSEARMIMNPITVQETDTLGQVQMKTLKYNITGVPVIDAAGDLKGILTQRDMGLAKGASQLVSEIMTPRENLITATKDISTEKALQLLHKHRIEKLPIIDEKGKLIGLVTIKDLKRKIEFPHACKDKLGRLRVAAACGVGPKEVERAEALIQADVDAIVIDSAHGHSRGIIEMVKKVKSMIGDKKVDVIAGNIATAEAAKALIAAGADAVKVGIGPGSICTTRIVAGVGVPQLSAVMECAEICRKAGVPLIADGGVKFSGDVVKALAAGAESVMLGSMLAGADETPGESILYQGRRFKSYRGMGSLSAMSCGSKDRYGQGDVTDQKKLVPEGVEGMVPSRGPVKDTLYQLMGGIRSGMGYLGAHTLDDLFEKAEFVRITAASLKESHPHDVTITKEAPNYSSKA